MVDLTGSTDPSSASNLVLYSCSNSKCQRTYGYILVNSKYYSVGITGSNGIGESTAITSTSCTSENIGTLYNDSNDIKLCLANNVGSQKIDDSNEANYFMINKSGNIFTGGSSNNDKYIGISASSKAFIYYNIPSKKYFYNILYYILIKINNLNFFIN